MYKIFYFKAVAALSMLFVFITLNAQTITTPRTPSPAATVVQTVGISTVTVKYSRPFVKGRAVWDSLVPYGWNKQGFGNNKPAPWRAGANENTTIEFSHNARVEGKDVPAGLYGLFFVVNKDNTGEVILSKDNRSWGSFFYEEANDQLKSKIQLRTAPFTEMLTYGFINDTKTSTELVLNWEKKQFPVKIEFDVDAIVMANAAEELKGPVGFNWQGFLSAANYSLNNKIDLPQGLKWVEQAVAQNKSFATLNVKSGILKAMGTNEEADKIMTEAIAMANENELNNYGYQLLGQGNIDKAVEVFVLNTKRHPESANAWDSLGECYVNKGDKKKAVESFKKSLSLNPPAPVKTNSEKFMKQLGAM